MTTLYGAPQGALPHTGARTATTPFPSRPRAGWDPRSLALAEGDLAGPTPRWARYALWALLAATAALYLIGLSASGWANAFYSAAAQAGADNWTAFLFGSSDLANSITVDKPPASIWVTALSVRIFGLSSWSLLVPQALLGVASVWLLFATVRRWYGDVAGLIAGAVLAVTPIAVLMFRFNNPDALLVLLLVAAAFFVTRAIEAASWRWLALAGVALGFAFLTKSLQALLVLPAFATAYAIAAPTTWPKRLRDLAIAGVALVISAGWWVLLVERWPAAGRPYIGGSQTNSVWELIIGYNGLGRLTGDEPGSVVPGAGPVGGGGMWGEPSWHRLFDASWAGGIAWLLPAAVVAAAVAFWLTRRERWTGRLRAGVALWGGWLVVTALVFSYAGGIIHEYYAVALAPAIAALVGIGAVMLWQLRDALLARLALAVIVTATGLYGASLLVRAGGLYATLGVTLSVVSVLVGAGLALVAAPRWQPVVASLALAAVLAGPLAFSLQTAASAHTGSLPSAGPTLGGGRGGPGLGGPGTPAATPPFESQPNGALPGQLPGGPARGTGGPGGLLEASRPSASLVAVLSANASQHTWVAAAVGSQNASGYQLATGHAVMPIGGFNGSDPSPTLAQFQQYVAEGRIHYFIADDGGPGGPGGPATGARSGSGDITQWVRENYTPTTVTGVTLYDLTA